MSLIGQRDCGLYGNILYLETIWIERMDDKIKEYWQWSDSGGF